MSRAARPKPARPGLRAETVDTGDGPVQRLTDDAESPLAWLYRRRGRDGETLVTRDEFEAGERLRADYTRAGLMPGVTSNWRDQSPVSGGRSSKIDLTDVAVAARQRVERALGSVGPELAGILVDVCCFLKGLELVETERRWPARSAKVVLKLALARLAAHYAPVARATGRDHAREISHWGAEDYRPRVSR